MENQTYLIKRSPRCLKGFFYIECKLKLWCLTILWKSRWVGGIFELGNPEGRRAQAVLEIQTEVGGVASKTVPSVMGVWIFSEISH